MNKTNESAAKKCRRDPVKESFWRDCFRRFEAAGLTVAAFCLGEGIKQTSFYYWRGEIRRRDAAEVEGPGEVFVELVPAVQSTVESVKVSVAAAELVEMVADFGEPLRPEPACPEPACGVEGSPVVIESVAAALPLSAGAARLDGAKGGRRLTSTGQGDSKASACEPSVPLELLLGGGWRLLIRPGCGQGLLQQVVAALVPLRDVTEVRGIGPPSVGPPGRHPAAFATAKGERC